MDNQNQQSEIQALKELLEKNLEISEEVLKYTKKINSFVFWERIFGFLKLVFIVVPLIIGLIYLPPLLSKMFSTYEELLGLKVEGGSSSNLQDSLKNYLK